MVESHGSVSEIREMARLIRNGSLDEVVGEHGDYDDFFITEDVKRDAILVEALNCLADRKEADRGPVNYEDFLTQKVSCR